MRNTPFNITSVNSTATLNVSLPDQPDDGGSSTGVAMVMRRLLTVVGSLGVITNGLALIVLLTFVDVRKRKTLLYIVNQTVADSLTGFFLFATQVMPSSTVGLDTGVASQLYCHIWVAQIPLWGFFSLSTYNLVALTLERYFSIVFPIRHKLVCTRGKILVSIAVMWVFAFTYQVGMTTPGVNIINGYCSIFSWDSPTTQQAKGIFGWFVDYFIPLLLLIFCYGRMFRALQTRVAPVASTQAPAGAPVASHQVSPTARAKRNVVRMMTLVATAFVLCTSWNQWWYVLYNVHVLHENSYTTSYYKFSVIALFSNCFVNPFIYAAKYDEFQNGVKKILRKLMERFRA